MAYPTYITEALVCGSIDSNTADRFFLLFTRELGMVHAYAKSVREERSKQRYALQECSHIRVTLVRGKSGWRIAGVEPIANLYTEAQTRAARALLRNLILLLRRVVHGEVAHEGVFDDVIRACGVTEGPPPEMLELIATLRILQALGYIAPHASYAHLCVPEFSFASSILAPDTEKFCRATIDSALRESQL